MSIQSFACKDTQALFEGACPRQFGNIYDVAIRKLTQLDYAQTLGTSAKPTAPRASAVSGGLLCCKSSQ